MENLSRPVQLTGWWEERSHGARLGICMPMSYVWSQDSGIGGLYSASDTVNHLGTNVLFFSNYAGQW